MATNETYQKKTGYEGEEIAAQYLRSKGYTILERNYHSRYGEIDLIAKTDCCIAFVEVKARTSDKFGMPEASVTPEKLEKIGNTGLLWLQEHPEAPDDWRIDVIAIMMDEDHQVTDLQHFVDLN